MFQKEKDFKVMTENYDKFNAVNARWAKTLRYAPSTTSNTSQNSPMENQ
jgi:hypothetical protein